MAEVLTGDACDILAGLDESPFHAIVTDPPYGLAFMGRDWDDFEPREYQSWCERWAALALEVLKPGGHLLAFSGNRTHHRLFSGVEDAGFEVRDTLTWHYGSGFPKALDVSKAIDKAAGAEREVVGQKHGKDTAMQGGNYTGSAGEPDNTSTIEVTAPATDAAREWDGFKTALKPATEFIVLARKPFNGTVAENVQEHGTGALNIDGCRIDGEVPVREPSDAETGGMNLYGAYEKDTSRAAGTSNIGRYPANVIFDGEAAEQLDHRNDQTVSTGGTPDDGQKDDRHDWAANVQASTGGLGDTGGPSRYFYTSKATRAERTLDGKIENAHPTVKPIDLMEWLVRLVTAENQHVLDPFAGTGTTGRAAKNLGRDFTLIEQSPKWADVARARCGLTPKNSDLLTDEKQATLST